MRSIRLAPAYDIVSTMIYESSAENMAVSIGGVCNINEITREAFAKEAVQDGLGAKMAMTRFDVMKERFPSAVNQAKATLKEQGFTQAEEIGDLILKRG